MTTLRLREEALADLASISDYGARSHGWPAAEAYLHSIDDALEQLKSYRFQEWQCCVRATCKNVKETREGEKVPLALMGRPQRRNYPRKYV